MAPRGRASSKVDLDPLAPPEASRPEADDEPRHSSVTRIEVAPVSLGPNAYTPGKIIAQKFQLVRVLGEGGMGSVWVAKNLALDVHVALKLIRAELAGSAHGLAERMLQEARAAACIVHPAITQVFDFGLTEAGDPFIAMELLHGESLADLLRRRVRVNPTRAVQTLLPIADALLSAHERGIVHRDLKPDNIFLARGAGGRLQPKVLDFGIAKLGSNTVSSLTGAGAVLGSPAYMSPEQARGEADVDARADIWAFSVVLYELVTGACPFEGDNYNALMFGILEQTPKSFSELGIDEPELWQIVARGLEKPRAARFSDMLEFGRALATWLVLRGISEDVCNASLESTWMQRGLSDRAGPPLSFFPSEPHELKLPVSLSVKQQDGAGLAGAEEMDAGSGVVIRPSEASDPLLVPAVKVLARSPAWRNARTLPDLRALVQSRLSRRARAIVITLLGAVLAFLIAAMLRETSRSGPHQLPLGEAMPSTLATGAALPLAKEPEPSLDPTFVPAPAASEDLSRTKPRVVPGAQKPAGARIFDRRKLHGDLKNPFR